MGRNSLGTGSTGVKGLSLTGHRQHELEANIPAAVKAFGEEIGAPRVTRVVHGEAIQVSDFKAFLKARKTDRYATDNGSVLIDPVTGFLVLRLKGIERGHIGRGSYNEGIAIYAGMGEKGQVIHEIDEATVLINYLVNDKHYPREQVLQGLGQILDDMLDNGNLDVWREVINVKWQAHKAGLEAQAQAESWDPKDLEKEIAAADKEMYKELEEVTKNLKPEMRSRLEDKLNELAELEAQSIDAGEGGTLLSLAVRAHREALSGVVGQATKDYDRVRQEIELRKEIVGIETLLGVWNDSEEFSASLGTASNTDDGNKPPTKGGITEEGLKLRVNSDGTEVAVFKDVPLDIKNFNGFGFQIMAIGRNKTGAEIIMAKSI
jgi:hypothetical protein